MEEEEEEIMVGKGRGVQNRELTVLAIVDSWIPLSSRSHSIESRVSLILYIASSSLLFRQNSPRILSCVGTLGCPVTSFIGSPPPNLSYIPYIDSPYHNL